MEFTNGKKLKTDELESFENNVPDREPVLVPHGYGMKSLNAEMEDNLIMNKSTTLNHRQYTTYIIRMFTHVQTGYQHNT